MFDGELLVSVVVLFLMLLELTRGLESSLTWAGDGCTFRLLDESRLPLRSDCLRGLLNLLRSSFIMSPSRFLISVSSFSFFGFMMFFCSRY